MVRVVFEGFLKDVGAFYERKVAPTDKAKDIWYDKVKKIPDESIPWIYDKIIDEFEGFPKNIKSTMWALYHQWLDAHPEKKAPIDLRNCSKGCLEGILFAVKLIQEVKYRYVFRCGKCRQQTFPQWPESTYEKLVYEGYEIIDYAKMQEELKRTQIIKG